MDFIQDKVGKIVQDLEGLIYRKSYPIRDILVKREYFKDIKSVDESEIPFEAFKENERWGGIGVHAWFRSSFKVPSEIAHETLYYEVKTGKSDTDWDAANPQFLAFVNGEITQGLDIKHEGILLTKDAKSEELYTFDLQGYGGTYNNMGVVTLSEMEQNIHVIDENVQELYYDLYAISDVVSHLKKGDETKTKLLKFLNTAVNMIDLRVSYSDEFFSSIAKAKEYLRAEFYEKEKELIEPLFHCVGHTHIDVAWLWDLAQTREKTVRSFSTVLKLMEEYPEYVFMSSQPQLYEFVKEEQPELYEKIREKVKEGSWEAEGSMWLEADCNISSGESLVRQIILGKDFFRTEFGIENEILWLPDVFGYNNALPQILKKANIKYFTTAKLGWNESNIMPCSTFMWQGLDGSEILTHLITTCEHQYLPDWTMTTYNGDITANHLKGTWEMYHQKDVNNEVLLPSGYGDGGGGTTRKMLEVQRRFEKGIAGLGRTKIGKAIDFFKSLEVKANENLFPKWVGELYFEYHRGTFTSMALNKKYNRKCEFLYEELETLAMLANEVLDYPYPKEVIDKGWKIICLNQFHDIIPGSSIEEVYIQSEAQYKEIYEIGTQLKNEILQKISAQIACDEDSVVVFNPTSFTVDELVETAIDGEEISFVAKNIPSKGYKVFSLANIEKEETELLATDEILENAFLSIKFDSSQNIISIYDKEEKRELIKDGNKANVFQVFEDRPHDFDAWNIYHYYKDKMWEVDDVINTEIVKVTNEKVVKRVERKFLTSTITQEIIMYAHSRRVDFRTNIDWKESQLLLKVAYPLDLHAEKATFDIQFGNIERVTHQNTEWEKAKFEVCAHKWADISEYGYGVSILNDCKYGYDVQDSNIRLTLIKSATNPNPNADKCLHELTYSLYPHKDNFKNADTVKFGYQLNQPLSVMPIKKQQGCLESEMSFASSNCENVVMEVVKKAEKTDDIVIRVHECYNKRTNAVITIPTMCNYKVLECDLEERGIYRELVSDGNSFTTEVKPFEIKTFKIIK